jgi:hypothetical protein
MRGCRALTAVLLFAFLSAGTVRAADKEKPKAGTVGGLIIEKEKNTMKVLVDGQEDVTTFTLPTGATPALKKTWNGIFNAARVRLSYKMNGDTREITGLAKPPTLARGTITGTVVKVYLKGFWVSVKPKNGGLDGFAQTFPCPEKVKETMKGLEKGDVVMIQYYTDFERHRVIGIRKIGKAPKTDKPESNKK